MAEAVQAGMANPRDSHPVASLGGGQTQRSRGGHDGERPGVPQHLAGEERPKEVAHLAERGHEPSPAEEVEGGIEGPSVYGIHELVRPCRQARGGGFERLEPRGVETQCVERKQPAQCGL